jgi:hypothetical protein
MDKLHAAVRELSNRMTEVTNRLALTFFTRRAERDEDAFKADQAELADIHTQIRALSLMIEETKILDAEIERSLSLSMPTAVSWTNTSLYTPLSPTPLQTHTATRAAVADVSVFSLPASHIDSTTTATAGTVGGAVHAHSTLACPVSCLSAATSNCDSSACAATSSFASRIFFTRHYVCCCLTRYCAFCCCFLDS